MQDTQSPKSHRASVLTVAASVTFGALIGVVGTAGMATTAIPTEHKGLDVSSAGAITSASMEAQIALKGYKLQLRKITIMPGGQIARHSHKNRPGVVKVISGTWVEGRLDGEKEYTANSEMGILEDSQTEHWFWNRGDTPATAMVCDIVPDK